MGGRGAFGGHSLDDPWHLATIEEKNSVTTRDSTSAAPTPAMSSFQCHSKETTSLVRAVPS